MSLPFQNDKIDLKVTVLVKDEQLEKLSRLLLDYRFLTGVGTGTENQRRVREIEIDISITKHFILFLNKMLSE